MRYIIACVCGVLITAAVFVGVANSQAKGDSRDGRRSLMDVLKVGDLVTLSGTTEAPWINRLSEERLSQLRRGNHEHLKRQRERRELEEKVQSGRISDEERVRLTDLSKSSPRLYTRIDRVVEIGGDFIAFGEDGEGGEKSGLTYIPLHGIGRIQLPGEPAPQGANRDKAKGVDE